MTAFAGGCRRGVVPEVLLFDRTRNYLGICAGAFIAGASPYNGFDLTGGVWFEFYSASNDGIRKASLAISSPRSPAIEHYWEDGPELTGWGSVVAKYPDGTPPSRRGLRAGAGSFSRALTPTRRRTGELG